MQLFACSRTYYIQSIKITTLHRTRHPKCLQPTDGRTDDEQPLISSVLPALESSYLLSADVAGHLHTNLIAIVVVVVIH